MNATTLHDPAPSGPQASEEPSPARDDHRFEAAAALVDQFLRALGHCDESIGRMPPEERQPLLRAAARYARRQLAAADPLVRFASDFD